TRPPGVPLSSKQKGAVSMTTAKPQHGNDQSDAADDLIAELAKLMAQDAQDNHAQQHQDRGEAAGEGHVPSAEPASTNTFAFRLPGDASPVRPVASAPVARTDVGAADKPAEAVQYSGTAQVLPHPQASSLPE